MDLSPGPGPGVRAREWLDEPEIERRRRYVGELPRRQFTRCRAALRILLTRRLDCPNRALRFGAGRRGKPYALIGGRRCRVSFNVSHSGDHGLIALAPAGRLGVDVEVRRARDSIDALIDTLLTAAEQERLAGLDDPARAGRFYDFWTAKEALLKATGLGHAIDVARIELGDSVGRTGEVRRLPEQTVLGGRWQIVNLGTPAFAAALARELATGS